MLHRLVSVDDAVRWLRSRMRGALRSDSRQVGRGDAFIAWPGFATDGRRYVADALRAGAAACLVDADGVEAFGFDDVAIAALPRLKRAAGEIAAALLGRPADRLSVIAVTGTNGKSSTAWWTAQALGALGRRCGVVGTLGIGEPPDRVEPTGLTTPDPITLQAGFARLVAAGCVACAVEASSIGLAEQRLAGTPVAIAQFTNFTRDHLDYHGDMQRYWAAKRALFDWPGLRAAVVHVDDEHGAALAQELACGGALELWPVGAHPSARLRLESLRYRDGGLEFEVVEGASRTTVHSTLIGDYNAGNLLVVLGALRALGFALADAAAVIPGLAPVPGRMQRLAGDGRGPEIVVDYAHTPDALDKALRALRPLAAARGGRLVCVFGCGGNRDASKRPMMGAIAHAQADRVVVTSDNPRDEPPRRILAQILAGMPSTAGVAVIEDRRAAIVHAVDAAAVEDVVLVAGKGHEDYQEIAGARRPFSDLAVAAQALRERQVPCH